MDFKSQEFIEKKKCEIDKKPILWSFVPKGRTAIDKTAYLFFSHFYRAMRNEIYEWYQANATHFVLFGHGLPPDPEFKILPCPCRLPNYFATPMYPSAN